MKKKSKYIRQFKTPSEAKTWQCFYCREVVDNGDPHKCLEKNFRKIKGRAPGSLET